MTEDMQVRNLSSHTQATYVQQVLLFARHFNKSPEILGPEEIRSYQIYLTNERKLAPSSIIIAVAALRVRGRDGRYRRFVCRGSCPETARNRFAGFHLFGRPDQV